MSETRVCHLESSGTLTYTLIRSSRRRTIGIEVHRDQSIKVRAPGKLPLFHIEYAIRQRADWIRLKQKEQSSRPMLPPLSYQHGSNHQFLGDDLTLCLEEGVPGNAIWHEEDRCLILRGRFTDEEDVQATLMAWYQVQAKRIFNERLQHWRYRLSDWSRLPERIQVRRMRRTWGSCNSAGRITLNTLAVRLPVALIDYILSHELCHLKEMNHSPAFYAWHQHLMPDYKARRVSLNRLEARALLL